MPANAKHLFKLVSNGSIRVMLRLQSADESSIFMKCT